LAYADSHVIDESDRVTGDYSSGEYLTSLSPTKWKRSYQVTATEEINDGLGVKNTILNASAMLFRKSEFDNGFRKTIENMRIAGDWYFIVHAIKGGKVHYEATKLNYHRRHSGSVIGKIISEKKINDFFLEFYMVQQFIFDNYRLSSDFHEKWEKYLRKLWNDFYPERPFDELKGYYPVDDMKKKVFLALANENVLDRSRLITQAKNEARVWENSKYYKEAEHSMHVFWSKNSDFITLFEQLDLTRVLELACGHGRHSEYILKHYASGNCNLVCMDINDSNIEFCKKRFKDSKNVEIIKNNGIDFYPIRENSVSSIFCYDAMVHFHKDVVASYLKDTYRVLKNGGKALCHHSNYFKDPHSSFGQNPHARAFMTQELFRVLSHQAGLRILEQKVINWGDEKNLDCISLLEKP
jgi:ubiquinone/menaquinone biosynthesis C-methylase UbiE